MLWPKTDLAASVTRIPDVGAGAFALWWRKRGMVAGLHSRRREGIFDVRLAPEAVVPTRTLGRWPSPTTVRRALMSYAEFQILDVF